MNVESPDIVHGGGHRARRTARGRRRGSHLFPQAEVRGTFCPTLLENRQNGKEKPKARRTRSHSTLRAPSVDASERADRALGREGDGCRRTRTRTRVVGARRSSAPSANACATRTTSSRFTSPGSRPGHGAGARGGRRGRGRQAEQGEQEEQGKDGRAGGARSADGRRTSRRRHRGMELLERTQREIEAANERGPWTSARRATRSTCASRSSRKPRTTSRGRWRSAR